MIALRKESLRQLVKGTHGAEIAEAAAVLPLMFMILLGIFWFGQAFSMYGAITRAAQEGARTGAAPLCTTCAPTGETSATYATNAVNAAMSASNLNPAWMQTPSKPLFTFCPGIPSTQCPATGAPCVQLPVQKLTSSPGGGDCGISVYFQYPFKFWLPFTSLNNQQIMLTASAWVRTENQ
jgi:TadE-like protein